MASVAFLVAVLVAAFLAHRFTTPLTRLTEASRKLAEGDLASRVPSDELSAGTLELRELSQQFNAMADRLEESVAIIRRDRDYSRDFLADVSHELRTPIAAMKMHVELLQGPAGHDEAARAEFLHSSARAARPPRLARPEPPRALEAGLRAGAPRPAPGGRPRHDRVRRRAAAPGRGAPRGPPHGHAPRPAGADPARPAPRRARSCPTSSATRSSSRPRGGEVRVMARQEPDGGARIEVVDTGVGIAAAELPLIFDRFYRGSEANEARGTGSGLGLAIVKSIVDMHHGSLAVESRIGHGSRFVVDLPKDPRAVTEVEPPRARRGVAAVRRWMILHRQAPRR